MGHDTVKAAPAAKINPNTYIYDRAKPGEARRVTEKLFKIFDTDGDGIITDAEITRVDNLDGKTPNSINEMRKKAKEDLVKMLEAQITLSIGKPIPKCSEDSGLKELPCKSADSEESKNENEIPESIQQTIYPSLSSWDIQCEASDCINNTKARIEPAATQYSMPVNYFKGMLTGSQSKSITKNDAVIALTNKNTLNTMKVLLGEKKPPKTSYPQQAPCNANSGMGMGMGMNAMPPQGQPPSINTPNYREIYPLKRPRAQEPQSQLIE